MSLANSRFLTGKGSRFGMTELMQDYFLFAFPSTAIVHFVPSGEVSYVKS